MLDRFIDFLNLRIVRCLVVAAIALLLWFLMHSDLPTRHVSLTIPTASLTVVVLCWCCLQYLD